MMSGENVSETLDEKLARIEQFLAEYPLKMGLGKVIVSNEIEKYLNISQVELRRLQPAECGEAAFLLRREALYIQMEVNKLHAKLKWCEQYLDMLIAPLIQQLPNQYLTMDMKKALAIKNDSVAIKLKTAMVGIQLKIDSMAFVPNQLNQTATTYERLQQDKHKN